MMNGGPGGHDKNNNKHNHHKHDHDLFLCWVLDVVVRDSNRTHDIYVLAERLPETSVSRSGM